MAQQSARLNVMIKAAEKAARSLVRDFGEVENLQVSRKGPGDFVSKADLRSESIIRDELEKARPDYAFIMEESGADEKSNTDAPCWIVDPLDGTTNFLHGIPHWAISIGLRENGKIVAGVIYDPIKDEMFMAERGGGAFSGRRRLRVSGRSSLQDAVVATGIPHNGRGMGFAEFSGQLNRVMPQVAGIRRLGACSLDMAYVAAGRYEGFWEWALGPWDIAAGEIIVKEAGGFVAALDGKSSAVDTGSVLATNAALQTHIAKLLKEPRAAKTA